MTDSTENLLRALSTKFDLELGCLRGQIQHGRMRFVPGEGSIEDLNELRISRWGKFGNSVWQLMNTILLAERLSIRTVRMPHHALLTRPIDLTLNGIAFSSGKDLPQSTGAYLEGVFYKVGRLFPDVTRRQLAAESARLARDYLIPLLLDGIVDPTKGWGDDVLAVHMRSGDVFSKKKPHPHYVQPPLSYYIKALHIHRRLHAVSKVILVFEDDGNPCIGAFQQHLRTEGIPFEIQSGTLREDVACLLQSCHIIASYGTFCRAIGLLSAQLSSMYCFRQLSEYQYAEAKNINVRVCTTSPAYIKIGEWQNTPDQLNLMLSFPEEGLSFNKV